MKLWTKNTPIWENIFGEPQSLEPSFLANSDFRRLFVNKLDFSLFKKPGEKFCRPPQVKK